MLYKIGTVTALAAVKNHLPQQVYDSIYPIVFMLDAEYGASRDVVQNDGGFVLVAETLEDVQIIQDQYQDMLQGVPEEVNILQCERAYINALYIKNNEFGVSVFMPLDLSPESLQKEAQHSNRL